MNTSSFSFIKPLNFEPSGQYFPNNSSCFCIQGRPHSRDCLMSCSAVDDVATIRPLFRSTTFAVMYFIDMNNLSTYRFVKVILQSS
uniref:Uncharacterized protein n=1 Tax=Medicago truncatula TaxID=3880 RepID=I3T9R3_MEDTR|nr:unknown [Medicago truncatula]